MMQEEASENKEDVDCSKQFEFVLLTLLYVAMTILYLTASTVYQFAFLSIVTIAILWSFGKKCWKIITGKKD